MSYNFDPELRPYLTLLPQGRPSNIAESRAFVAEFTKQSLATADTTGLRLDDRLVPGVPERAVPDVAVRLFIPDAPAEAVGGGILYIHGGGFTVGSVDMEQAQAATLARSLGVTVISVEYRLAPEHPFPAAIEDCYAALAWFTDRAAELGVDEGRIAVVGNSAGGGLAAGLALLARDRGGPRIHFQYLGIPELDDRLQTPSMQAFVDTPMWSRPQAERSWSMYLGAELAERGDVSPYAAPARATDVAGLPPAYVSAMEFDPMRDEAVIYALRLLQAGVSTELHTFPGVWHGARSFPAAVTQRDADEMVVVLRRALAGAPRAAFSECAGDHSGGCRTDA